MRKKTADAGHDHRIQGRCQCRLWTTECDVHQRLFPLRVHCRTACAVIQNPIQNRRKRYRIPIEFGIMYQQAKIKKPQSLGNSGLLKWTEAGSNRRHQDFQLQGSTCRFPLLHCGGRIETGSRGLSVNGVARFPLSPDFSERGLKAQCLHCEFDMLGKPAPILKDWQQPRINLRQ